MSGNFDDFFVLDRGVKPSKKQTSSIHQILVADSAPYIKIDPQWLEYGKCIGYR